MNVHVFLNLQGQRHLVGLLKDDPLGLLFQYAPDFIKLNWSLSPVSIPLSTSTWKSTNDLFNGLPGFIAYSLPDGWGSLLLDRQLRKKGKRLHQISPLERLCWVGNQGMGALEYEPATEREQFESDEIHLDTLAQDVDAILKENESAEALDMICGLNGSSGGARPKIVCLVSKDKKQLQRGVLTTDSFDPWMIKFQHSSDSKDIGIHEYICSLIAKRAGITMPQTHLFESQQGGGWFGTQRFDRNLTGKYHVVTAAGLLHSDFRLPSLDYATLMALTLRLCGMEALLEQFKRAILNFSLGNCDDHAKNFSFMMNEEGKWSLTPAYDIVTTNAFGNEHMTSLLGKGRDVDRDDFIVLAKRFDIARDEANHALDQVADAVDTYKNLAKDFGVKAPSELTVF